MLLYMAELLKGANVIHSLNLELMTCYFRWLNVNSGSSWNMKTTLDYIAHNNVLSDSNIVFFLYI